MEGPDGSGKTTILEIIKERLKDRSIDFVTTREPGGTKIGEDIRNIILDNNNTKLSHQAEALLYAASRAQHVDELIKPALEEGKMVISDRFLLSSLAYQGVGRGLGIDRVNDINQFGLDGLEPDLILFFHIDPLETLRRKTKGQEGDRLELEGDNFHKKVYEGYMQLLDRYENLVVIDASGTIEEVAESTLKEIEKLIESR